MLQGWFVASGSGALEKIYGIIYSADILAQDLIASARRFRKKLQSERVGEFHIPKPTKEFLHLLDGEVDQDPSTSGGVYFAERVAP